MVEKERDGSETVVGYWARIYIGRQQDCVAARGGWDFDGQVWTMCYNVKPASRPFRDSLFGKWRFRR